MEMENFFFISRSHKACMSWLYPSDLGQTEVCLGIFCPLFCQNNLCTVPVGSGQDQMVFLFVGVWSFVFFCVAYVCGEILIKICVSIFYCADLWIWKFRSMTRGSIWGFISLYQFRYILYRVGVRESIDWKCINEVQSSHLWQLI